MAFAEVDAWHAKAKAHVVMLPVGEVFTSDDLTEAVGAPQAPTQVGACLNAWESQGIIRQTGYSLPSTRPSRKGAKVVVWERVKR